MMNRFMQIFNFLGVIALAALCIVQWRADGRLNTRNEVLNQTIQAQATKLAEQGNSLKNDEAALDETRQRLAASQTSLRDAQSKLAQAQTELTKADALRKQAEQQRDQFKTTLDKWVAAVNARDDALKQAAAQVRAANAKRDDAVRLYNDLVNKYNALAASGHDK